MPVQTGEAVGPGSPPQSPHCVLRTKQGGKGWDPEEGGDLGTSLSQEGGIAPALRAQSNGRDSPCL